MSSSNVNAKPTWLSCKLKPALANIRKNTAWAARGPNHYIGAVIKYEHPRQSFAQRTLISAIAHYTRKASKNDRGTALGLHGGQRWRTRSAKATTRVRGKGKLTAGHLPWTDCEQPIPQTLQSPHHNKKKPGAGGITAACTLSSPTSMDEPNAEVNENAAL